MAVETSSEVDVILNRANLVHARSLRVLQSLLPKATDSAKSKELEQAEDEAFTPMPESAELLVFVLIPAKLNGIDQS